MENSNLYTAEELQKCPFHNQQNNMYADKTGSQSPDKHDESGTDPNRYEPDKFEKGPNENSGGDGSTESAAEELDNL
jgi:hypothetical protein